MSKADVWVGSTVTLSAYIDDIDLGYDIARRIAEKTTSITVIRGGAAQTAQNVRIEEDRGDRTVTTEGGRTSSVDAIVFGYKGHASITDTDLQPGDRFRADGVDYEIVALMPGLVDSLQAYARIRV